MGNVFCSNCQTSSNNHSQDQTINDISSLIEPQPPIPLETWILNVQNAVKEMELAFQASISPQNGTSEPTVPTVGKAELQSSNLQKGCNSILMYIKNIKQYPTIPRYRKISTNNASYKVHYVY